MECKHEWIFDGYHAKEKGDFLLITHIWHCSSCGDTDFKETNTSPYGHKPNH